MSRTFERRMGATVMEVREASDGVTLSGYAATYNEPYSMGWYTETVKPGAFRRTLGTNPDVRLLVNHAGLPLARTTSGTLLLDGENARGLHVQAGLDVSDPDVQALIPKMRRGDLNGMSFTFGLMGVDADEWSKDMSQRSMLNLEINDGDVAVVTYPANRGAQAGIRADGPGLDAVNSAMRTLSSRDATSEDIASLLARAQAYFSAIDSIADGALNELTCCATCCATCAPCAACDAPCGACGNCGAPCAVCGHAPGDSIPTTQDDTADVMAPMRAAAVAKELRGRTLALIG